MKKRWLILCLIVLLFPVICLANSHGPQRVVKKGILLVAFGSSLPEAQVSFENIDKRVKLKFPDIPVHWAYTSSIIRKKLAKQGKHLDSVTIALSKMMDQSFTHVAVQSLHTIRGSEFNDLVRIANAFQGMPGGIQKIMVGSPLLSSPTDMDNVVDAILKNIPADRKKTDAVVLMGHGTHHPANAFYAALMFNLQRKDPNVFVGTVEGSPQIDDIMVMLRENKIEKIILMPFMSVAGDHARNDMAGNEQDSWKSILEKAGFQCEIIMKGTAEYDNMIDIWMGHLDGVMAHHK